MMQNKDAIAGNQQVSPGVTEIKPDAGTENSPGLQYVWKVNTIDSGDRIYLVKYGLGVNRDGSGTVAG